MFDGGKELTPGPPLHFIRVYGAIAVADNEPDILLVGPDAIEEELRVDVVERTDDDPLG